MARASKYCIFCGGSPTTREHIWADWLAKYIPKTMQKHSSTSSILNPDRSVERTLKVWGGDPRSRRLQIVCRHCNNHWMSELQAVAKPILIRLVSGNLKNRPFMLDLNRQRILAAWSAMSVICAEYFHPVEPQFLSLTGAGCSTQKRRQTVFVFGSEIMSEKNGFRIGAIFHFASPNMSASNVGPSKKTARLDRIRKRRLLSLVVFLSIRIRARFPRSCTPIKLLAPWTQNSFKSGPRAIRFFFGRPLQSRIETPTALRLRSLIGLTQQVWHLVFDLAGRSARTVWPLARA
jgi:hypothetical protein